MAEQSNEFSIAIVGMGPRGTYALSALVEMIKDGNILRPICIHLVEPQQTGAGLVYDTRQPDWLMMNTVAGQITAYPEAKIYRNDYINKGPTLYEYLSTIGRDIDENTYPPRRDHGLYLRHVVGDTLDRLPSNVRVCIYKSQATDLARGDGRVELFLQEGFSIICDQLLITAGNVGNLDTKSKLLRREGLKESFLYIENPYPIEQLNDVKQGQVVGILGLGLTSIDAIVALTIGRGGKFVGELPDLKYVPSGLEPTMLAWSRTGSPLRARGSNQKGLYGRHTAKHFTRAAIDQLVSQEGRLDFKDDILPLLLQELEYAYKSAPGYTQEEYGEFDWEAIINPKELAGPFNDSSSFSAALIKFMESDVLESMKGNVNSPLKAAADVLRDLRDDLRYIVEYGGLTPSSHRWFNTVFTGINNQLAVGPPLFRTAQIIALAKSGHLDFGLGPNPTLVQESGEVRVVSSVFQEKRTVALDALIDGRVQVTVSSLVKNLVLRRYARKAVNQWGPDRYELNTIEVTRDGRIVSSDGSADDQISASGQFAEGTIWYPQAAARPGVNSRALLDAYRWATRIAKEIRSGA